MFFYIKCIQTSCIIQYTTITNSYRYNPHCEVNKNNTGFLENEQNLTSVVFAVNLHICFKLCLSNW